MTSSIWRWLTWSAAVPPATTAPVVTVRVPTIHCNEVTASPALHVIRTFISVSADEVRAARAALRPAVTRVSPEHFPSRIPIIAEMQARFTKTAASQLQAGQQ